jgi:hypothetical protein
MPSRTHLVVSLIGPSLTGDQIDQTDQIDQIDQIDPTMPISSLGNLVGEAASVGANSDRTLFVCSQHGNGEPAVPLQGLK